MDPTSRFPMAEPNSPHLAFTAGAFALALAAGFVAALASLAQMSRGDSAGLGDPMRLSSGESARAVTRAVNDGFAPRKAFHRIERSLAWLALGDWGPRVRAGCAGWLFLADELESHASAGQSASLRATLVKRVRDRLERQAIALLVVVVPDKSRIEAARLCGLERAPRSDPRIATWVASLRAQGVDALDLSGVLAGLPGERYYRTDTHWNERAAEAAAEVIAARLRARSFARVQATMPAPLELRIIERPGDLVRLAGLDGLPAQLRPAPDVAEARDVPPVAAAGDDLFGSSSLPAFALVGTSFSRTSNFVPFLARHLGEQVANAAKEGGDFDGAATAYLASPAFRESPPKVLVWEIPERAIEPAITQAERRWLEGLASP